LRHCRTDEPYEAGAIMTDSDRQRDLTRRSRNTDTGAIMLADRICSCGDLRACVEICNIERLTTAAPQPLTTVTLRRARPDGGIRKELAAGVKESPGRAGALGSTEQHLT